MTGFVPTELRRCGECKKDYVTALLTEQQGDELALWEEPCPYCRTTPTAAGSRRERGTAGFAPAARGELRRRPLRSHD